ncbi:MAG: hydroxyacid dehydrogenase [Butyrivibrio sp.]|nr:hydroxyacid dehydrogenase [Butyrivibrio sp.]
MERLSYSDLLDRAENTGSLYEKEIEEARKELKASAKGFDKTWVVLDDDPTGVQTVHDIAVYTDWEKETLFNALKNEKGMFYILTNSRGITAEASEKLHKELMDNLILASKESKVPFCVISRSDSTLRGHFPLETDIIAERMKSGLDIETDGVILAPFFHAGGRITCGNTHYVKYGDDLVPAGETEFAKDETFGYKNSDLCMYVEEKTKGRIKAGDVITISLELLRQGDLEAVEKELERAKNGAPIVVNALEASDLEVFGAALYRSISKGKNFVYRTAADFVKAVGGISDKALLNGKSLDVAAGRGGIIMIGSHTAKTTAQLDKIRDFTNLEFIEYDSDKVLENGLFEETVKVSCKASSIIEKGRTAVVYTKRKVLTLEGDTKEAAIIRSAKISDAFTAVVEKLSVKPAFIIGKGGITSSDIGTKALKVKRAMVPGQIQPGIPVWKTDENCRFPNIPYIIFPGNVGDEDTLKKVLEGLTG